MGEAVCEACGSRNPTEAEFCRTCGAYLRWDGAARLVSDQELEAEEQRRRQVVETHERPAADGPAGAGATPGPRPPCPVCGTRAEAGRCWCRRCGQALSGQAPPASPSAARVPWWRRWRTREAEQARAARSSYRRSLPVRYRLTRVLTGVVLAAVVGAALAVADRNPLGWARSAAADLRGATEPVEVVEVSTEPAGQELPGHPARRAVDAFSDSWWATSFDARRDPLPGECAAPGDGFPTSVLVLDLGEPTVLRELWITPAPPEDDPQASQWSLPSALVVRFDDRSCRRLTLEPEREPQLLELEVTAERLVLAVVAVADDEPPLEPRIGIADVELRSRGG